MRQFKSSGRPKYLVRCRSSKGEWHLYLLPKSRRGKFSWAPILRAAVFDSFEDAMDEAASVLDKAGKSYQIVPVGYAGAPYWQDKRHVHQDGVMASYTNPRIFLTDPATGKSIEV